MIKIQRPNLPPVTLTSQGVIDAREKIRGMVNSGCKPKALDFPKHWGKPDVRAALWTMQHGKCCYCERLRDVNRESDIEHFRPKAEITEEPSPNALGYWWLAYDWENLFFSCRCCNQEYKKNQFPLLPHGIRATGPGGNLNDEQAYLVDPAKEEPEKFIGFDWQNAYGVAVFPYGLDGASGRGQRTIDIVGLQRSDLDLDRAALVRGTLEPIVTKMKAGQHFGCTTIIESAKADIASESSASRPYAGFRRAFFRAAGLGEFVSKD